MKRLLFDTDVKAIRDAKLRGKYPGIDNEDDLIDAVPTADLSELWIPVTERVPEDEKSVLVITKNGKPWVAHYDLKWRGWRTSGSTTITHWMPLPGAPKKEGEDDPT